MSTFGTGIWDFVLSILVTLHFIVEFIHYGHEYISARKEKKALKSIQECLNISKTIKPHIQIHKPTKRKYGQIGNVIQDRMFEEWEIYHKQAILDERIDENKIVHDNMIGCTEEFSNFIHERLAQLVAQRRKNG